MKKFNFDGLFLFKSIDLGFKSKITGIQFNLGSLIMSSKDHTLKISEPNLHSNLIKTIDLGRELGAVSSN